MAAHRSLNPSVTLWSAATATGTGARVRSASNGPRRTPALMRRSVRASVSGCSASKADSAASSMGHTACSWASAATLQGRPLASRASPNGRRSSRCGVVA
jgi:hypothetical protein